MGNFKVALLRYVKTAKGWRRIRVETVRRGRGWDERLDAPEGTEILKGVDLLMGRYSLSDSQREGLWALIPGK